MHQYELHAYEALGLWRISLHWRDYQPEGSTDWEPLYRGDHVPIDEEDPQVRSVLLLHQVYTDLNRALMGELDTLAERPAHH